ncbi:MAG TPA: amidohydrolase family protein [Caulobacteraceae bacterium]|nr:amidohydrolase family protein [Caulobacteraceae bacterium]
MAEVDLVVRGGTVADGLGSPLFEADVAVEGGRIVEVGKVAVTGREEIDAKGLLVTPGFVDIHTHYDGQAVWDSRLAPSSWHGVTTAVMGNCGVGFAPVRAPDRDVLIELMEGVEDIPGTALHEGLDFSWESFGDYLDALAARPRDIDIAAQLPHGALRVYVMGERAVRLEAATAQDIAAMRALAAQAMREGAIGFTTTRSMNHRTVKGDPTPSLRAAADELEGIALGLKDAGRGVLQFISDFDTPSLDVEFDMLRSIASASGRPLSISVAQAHGNSMGRWRDLLDRIAAANADGIEMRGQVAPRPIGILLGLQGSASPFLVCPIYREMLKTPLADKLARLRDPDFRARLMDEFENRTSRGRRHLVDFDNMFPLGETPDYEPAPETSVARQAERIGVKPHELALDLMLKDEGRAFLYSPFANYADKNLDVVREMLTHPHTIVGLGDGGAHVSVIADASFPTYLLAHWGRDRPEGRLDLSWLIKRQTSDTARAVGLLDRGIIAPGLKGDLNVIDFDKLGIEAPIMTADLPAGGRRLLQKARGYRATIVSGQVVYRDGEPTGALPGALVRGSQQAVALVR